ncbi:MAG: tetratricopeptide repeat protein [Betaproteobacteria bacterium]|nr:tetratricopeptide repeat protein [Betaproteobacteria bacterium]
MEPHLRIRAHRAEADEDMRHWWIAPAVLALSACATPEIAPVQPSSLLRDEVFQARPVPADPDVFAVSDSMRRYLEVEIARQLRTQGHLHGLVAALQSSTQLKLDYDAAVTRTAAEAFEARSGNCLSLTIMTAALARELGLSVSFRRAFSAEAWTRRDNTLFLGGHVNIMLARAPAERLWGLDRVSGIIVDFLPHEDLRRQRSWEIRENTVTAMFMNNRAAETMAAGLLDEAYWWARGAIRQDPRFLEAVNTLGVIYFRHGNLAEAERAFQFVLAQETENTSALSNLANVLETQGREKAALALRDKLQRIEPYPPFHFSDLGFAALKRREFEAARGYFARELARNAAYHEAQFGLAVAYLGLGDSKAAQRHLAAALEASTTRREHDIYAAKLEWLRSHRAQ